MKIKYFATLKIKYKDRFGDSVCLAFENRIQSPFDVSYVRHIYGVLSNKEKEYKLKTYYGFSAN